jgi:hypothetical protein
MVSKVGVYRNLSYFWEANILRPANMNGQLCIYGGVRMQDSVADPDSLDPDPDPAFQVNPDTDPGVEWPEVKKYSWKIFFFYFDQKMLPIYLTLGLHKGRQSYEEKPQP